MCPISFPICIPIYMWLLFSLLVSMGLSVHSAFAVSGVIGLFLLYVSVKLFIRLCNKVKSKIRSRGTHD